jgi:Mce-associated membrane protein
VTERTREPYTLSVARIRGWLRARRRVAGWAAAWAVALAVCGAGAWSYAGTRGDDALSYGKARDAALADGTRDIARLNTVDAAHAAADLDRWLDATTGPLHDRMSTTHSADAATVKQSGTSTRGEVTAAAVTELDTRAGTAKLIATVEVHLTPSAGTPTTDRKRFEADLSRTGDGWKLSALTAVPAGSS